MHKLLTTLTVTPGQSWAQPTAPARSPLELFPILLFALAHRRPLAG